MEKIDKVIKNKSYFNIYRSTYICHTAKEIIKKELKIDKDISVLNYKHKTIRVKLSNPYLSSEAKIRKNKIIKMINDKIGQKEVQNISFC